MYTLRFLTTGALLTHLFYRNTLGQTDRQIQRRRDRPAVRRKLRSKRHPPVKRQLCVGFFPVVYKYAWTLATSCHAKTSRNGLHYCASLHKTRSGLVLFVYFLISQEKLKVSHASQPALLSGLCALFVTGAIEVQFEEAFIFRRCFPLSFCLISIIGCS